MNKKVIKYLIWTIVIFAILVLIPIKNAIASPEYPIEVKYSTFKTSQNLFCLNKGQPFHSKENFKSSNISGGTYTFPNNNNKTVDTDVLKYIVSESDSGKYEERTNVGNYVPQIAIWKLAGYNLTNQNAELLINKARAYNEAITNSGGYITTPKIVKEENKLVIYYSEAYYGGTSYSNLIDISITGVEQNYDKINVGSGGYSHKRIYTPNSTSVSYTVNFENSRSADLKQYRAEERTSNFTKILLTQENIDNATSTDSHKKITTGTYFKKIGDSIRCNGCGGLNELKRIRSDEDVEDALSNWGDTRSDKSNFAISISATTYDPGCIWYYCETCKEDEILYIDTGYYSGESSKYYLYTPDSGGWIKKVEFSKEDGTSTEKPQNLLYGTGSVSTDTMSETISFIQPVTLSFNKQDFSGNPVSGATLKIEAVDNVNTLSASSIPIGSNSVTVMPANGNSETFKIKLTETAPTGYKPIPATTLTVHYSNGEVDKIESTNTTYVPEIKKTDIDKTITIKNQPLLNNLKIVKRDKLTPNVLIEGVTFKIELTGVESMTGYEIATKQDEDNYPTLIYAATDKNGEINLNGLVLNPNATQITAKITEISVPYTYENKHPDGYYYKVDSTPIEITITYSNGSWEVTRGNATSSGGNVSVPISNQPYISLSGMVWNDGQTGEKNIQAPNGNKDNGEKALEGVLVELYSVKDKKLIQSTTTDKNGQYKFEDVSKTNEGYEIIFRYDGINWQETKSIRKATGGDSDASEEATNRINFNNKFKTISKDKAEGIDGKTITLGYNEEDGTSELKVNMNGTNPVNNNATDFQMSAQTTTYTNTISNIDLGLVKKELDLAIGTDVKEAILKINDKETKYTYAQIMNGEMADSTLDGILQNNSSAISDDEVKYNLYLYTSDYYYRIDDYNTGITNNVTENIYNRESDSTLKELEAYVTYNVILKNQTTHNARVDEFVYYYDAAYKPYEILTNDYNYSIDTNARKITFTIKDNTKFNLTNPNYRVEIDITFEVNKDSEDNLIVNETATNIAEITRYSTSEGGLIDKDSAPGNANITFDETGTPKVGQYEDDTYEAKGLNIVLRTEETRTIKGTVFEDLDKDGILDDGKPVNDVIVQLIEIKEIGGKYYEYIWQETKSGSNEVKTTARNGYNQTKYTNTLNPTTDIGVYEFKDFIPGNYIIRYIYGDGTRVIKGTILENIDGEENSENKEPLRNTEVGLYSLTENKIVKTTKTNENGEYEFKDYISGNYKIRYMHNGVVKEAEATESKSYTNSQKKYNGEDYKSTKDPNYRQNWYNTSTYSNGASIARDNEARRLEVMANTITINGSNEFNYANTWMCAETSLINIPVDAYDKSKTEIPENSDNTSTTNNSTKLAYDYTEKGETVLFGNMNFGLALRPNTNIVLEKHITALKITPSGTGVQPIVDASKNIEAYYDEDADNDSPKGMTQGLATVMSTRDNRGFWQVATDVEELMQGAELEVEYTYVIKNDSERDYLNSFVVEEYYNNIGKDVNNNGQDDYSEYLRGASGSVKTSKKGKTHEYGTYLGQYYYTGEIPLTNADVNLDGRINNQDSILLQQYINGYNIEIYGGDINNDGRINNQDYILLQQYINNVTIIEHESVGVVPSRVEIFEEAINNDLVFDNEAGTSFKITEQDVDRNVYGVDKNDGTKAVKINSVVRNSTVNEILLPGEKDANKIITLRTTLSTVAGGELGANIPSYIAELVQYSNAAGRRNMNATPRNLKYVHSDDTTMTMVTAPNEVDEFWGESIIITKPTGEDKITPIQIAIITISAVAVLGVGIVLIKKFVLKK